MNEEVKTRYYRQLLLPGFGEAEQDKLGSATVLIAGAGGLGSPVSIYLAAAGVGNIILCDFDTVELSNLNRQVLHGTSDIDSEKIKSAKEFLTDLNPHVNVEVHNDRINIEKLQKIGKDVNVIADCLDNISARMDLNQFSLEAQIPLVHAGIEGWSGQLTTLAPPETPCMHCLFGDSQDTPEKKPVLGAMAAIIGSTQALEIIHLIAGTGSTLKNELLHFDGQAMQWNKLKIGRNDNCSVCGSTNK